MSNLQGIYQITILDKDGNIKQEITSKNAITQHGYWELFRGMFTERYKHSSLSGEFIRGFYLFDDNSPEEFFADINKINTSKAVYVSGDVTRRSVIPDFKTVDLTKPVKLEFIYSIQSIEVGELNNITRIAGVNQYITTITTLPEPFSKSASDQIKITYTLEYYHTFPEAFSPGGITGTITTSGIQYPVKITTDLSDQITNPVPGQQYATYDIGGIGNIDKSTITSLSQFLKTVYEAKYGDYVEQSNGASIVTTGNGADDINTYKNTWFKVTEDKEYFTFNTGISFLYKPEYHQHLTNRREFPISRGLKMTITGDEPIDFTKRIKSPVISVAFEFGKGYSDYLDGQRNADDTAYFDELYGGGGGGYDGGGYGHNW